VTTPSNQPPYPDRAQGMTFLTLAATPTAVSCARQLVHLTLNRWGLAALVEDAELVTSELITNAVQATGVTDPDAAWGDAGALATIQVRVLMYQASIVIEVWDRDPSAPVRHDAVSDEEGGRGLMIVTALCKEWDYFYAARGGKVVWAELAVPAELPTPAGLPRRVRGMPVVARNRADFIRDPGLLRRVHRGLKDL